MTTAEERVTVTLEPPRSVVERVAELASSREETVDAAALRLLEQGLRQRELLRESLERARAAYEAELAQAGEARPTSSELWEQMRRIRDEVADELYPD